MPSSREDASTGPNMLTNTGEVPFFFQKQTRNSIQVFTLAQDSCTVHSLKEKKKSKLQLTELHKKPISSSLSPPQKLYNANFQTTCTVCLGKLTHVREKNNGV